MYGIRTWMRWVSTPGWPEKSNHKPSTWSVMNGRGWLTGGRERYLPPTVPRTITVLHTHRIHTRNSNDRQTQSRAGWQDCSLELNTQRSVLLYKRAAYLRSPICAWAAGSPGLMPIPLTCTAISPRTFPRWQRSSVGVLKRCTPLAGPVFPGRCVCGAQTSRAGIR